MLSTFYLPEETEVTCPELHKPPQNWDLNPQVAAQSTGSGKPSKVTGTLQVPAPHRKSDFLPSPSPVREQLHPPLLPVMGSESLTA